MVRIGMLLSDRYEILEKIGSGGMSDVYKAKCHKLNRLVAIKVLKQEYSTDKNFVGKFWAEAQSAACLTHPNIVNVYDVGNDQGVYYIVMELVEGITLKKYIEKRASLRSASRSASPCRCARAWKRLTSSGLSIGISSRRISSFHGTAR